MVRVVSVLVKKRKKEWNTKGGGGHTTHTQRATFNKRKPSERTKLGLERPNIEECEGLSPTRQRKANQQTAGSNRKKIPPLKKMWFHLSRRNRNAIEHLRTNWTLCGFRTPLIKKNYPPSFSLFPFVYASETMTFLTPTPLPSIKNRTLITQTS